MKKQRMKGRTLLTSYPYSRKACSSQLKRKRQKKRSKRESVILI
jgi:hypothetical protein